MVLVVFFVAVFILFVWGFFCEMILRNEDAERHFDLLMDVGMV